jgi:hypothetical protein
MYEQPARQLRNLASAALVTEGSWRGIRVTANASRDGRIEWTRGMVLLVQAVLLALVPLADARFESRAIHSEVHVEAERDSACTPPHAQHSCLTCRFLTAFSSPPATNVKHPVRSWAHTLATSSDQSAIIATNRFSSSQSRAPPFHS